MITLLKRIYGLISGSGFLWKLARNYKVLNDACKAIETVLVNVAATDRKLPDMDESQILLSAISNILKTGIIDIPGVDEMQIAIGLDHINKNISLSVTDAKSGKFMEIPLIKKVEVKNVGP